MATSLKERLFAWADRSADEDFRRRIAHISTRGNEFGYDAFGFNPEEARIALLAVRWIHRHYFRTEVHGVQNVPDGRVLLIANHSGQLPFDGVCIGGALFYDREPPRMVRAMVEKWIPELPFASYLFPRWGQILGDPENCRRVLADGEAILVFPEGVKGISKPFTKRYQLEEFGLGFMRLALETKTSIVPVAVIGAEEQAPAFNLKPLAKLLGIPAFPLMPLPPFLPILPLPTKYRIHFGEPLCFTGDADDDDEVVRKQVRVVQNAVMSLLKIGLKERKHIFW
ncbi:MAG: lysophospholipid acyltransferase family protein [Myxococcota bacterium]